MSQVQEQPPTGTRPTWLELIVQKKKETAYVLFGVFVLLAVATVLLIVAWRRHTEEAQYLWFSFWTGCVGVTALGVGLWHLFNEPTGAPPLDEARLLVLAFGGGCGLITAILGVGLAWAWWDDLLSWLHFGEGKEFGRAGLALVAFFVGLAIMFVSLQLARTEERSNVFLRRLLYGYNTALTGILLLAILAGINTLVYANFPGNLDFTASNIYTLSQRSKNILKGLDQPVKIFVILSKADPLHGEVDTLLTNCRKVNDKILVEEMATTNQARMAELEQKYPDMDFGLMIVYGSGEHEDHWVIKRDDLVEQNQASARNPDDKPSFKFRGEDALMTQINFLQEGKKKPVVYFTQGHGELDINDEDPSRLDRGAGALRRRLGSRGFEVKELPFGPTTTQVPEDAAAVVIAGPRKSFTEEIDLKPLREYLKKNGKLLVLLDVLPTPQGTMEQIGLEKFLAEYNVDVSNQVVFSVPTDKTPNAVEVLAEVNPDLIGRNPIADSFKGSDPFTLIIVRKVGVGSQGRGEGHSFVADPLLVTYSRLPVWTEDNLRVDPDQEAFDLVSHPEEAKKKLTSKVPVAVAVTESVGTEAKPKLVVFGDATLACNNFIAEGGGKPHFELLASCLDWLRERPNSIGIEPKKRDIYAPGTATAWMRLMLLPPVLMVIVLAGLGTGVWLVRRR